MRALVLGARGAVGRVVVGELHRGGHEVTPAGRTGPPGGLAIDVERASDLRALQDMMADHDVVINASGIESSALAGVGPLVEVSATASYLDTLASDAVPGIGAVHGCGLAPGLSTLLISSLATSPGDDIDLGIMLGTGEPHGAAAVEWTARLLGRAIHAAPERGETIWNLREQRRLADPGGRSRTYLRADFPDHVLIGQQLGVAIRSYLALSSRAATRALGLAARAPRGRGIVSRSPHWGTSAWHLVAINRRTQETATVQGHGQSAATGVLTAWAAERLCEDRLDRVVSMAALGHLADAQERLRASPLTSP